MAPLGALLGLTLPAFANAATSFAQHCTTPSRTYNLVSSPDVRGTVDVLWGSLFTVVTCTWTILHMTASPQRQKPDKHRIDSSRKIFRASLRWKLLRFLLYVRRTVCAVLAPELLLAVSVKALFRAFSLHRRFCLLGDDIAQEWTLTHILYAEMGGFVLKDDANSFQNTSRLLWLIEQIRRLPTPERISKNIPSPAAIEDARGPAFEERPVLDADEMSELDLHLRKQEESEIVALLEEPLHESLSKTLTTETSQLCEPTTSPAQSEGPSLDPTPEYDVPYHILGETILFAIEKQLIPRKPPITEDDITDMGKSEPFGLTLAAAQITWFVVNILVRAVRRIHISQLEIFVSALCACSTAIYVAHFWTSNCVKSTTTLMTFDGYIPSEVIEYQRDIYQAPVSGRSSRNIYKAVSSTAKRGIIMIVLQLGCLLFGAINIAAWNYEFPTKIDQTLWRCAAVITASIPILFGISADPKAFTSGLPLLWPVETDSGFSDGAQTENKTTSGVSNVLRRSLTTLFLLAKAVLIVEMLRCSFHLPPGAFRSTWASLVPRTS